MSDEIEFRIRKNNKFDLEEILDNQWEIIKNIIKTNNSEVFEVKSLISGERYILKVIEIKKENMSLSSFIEICQSKIIEIRNLNMFQLLSPHFALGSEMITQPVYFYKDGKIDSALIGIFMKYRQSLQSLINEKHNFSEDEIFQIALSVCNFLIDIAREDFVHLDIKPSNIYVGKKEKTYSYYLVGDFGCSRKKGSKIITYPFGTREYLSYEAIVEDKTANIEQQDVYMLGIMLYQLANSNVLPTFEERFFKSSNLKELNLENKELERIIFKACQKSTVQRYKSIQEMFFDLCQLVLYKKTSCDPQPIDNFIEDVFNQAEYFTNSIQGHIKAVIGKRMTTRTINYYDKNKPIYGYKEVPVKIGTERKKIVTEVKEIEVPTGEYAYTPWEDTGLLKAFQQTPPVSGIERWYFVRTINQEKDGIYGKKKSMRNKKGNNILV